MVTIVTYHLWLAHIALELNISEILEMKPVTNCYYLLVFFNKVRALCILSSEIILL